MILNLRINFRSSTEKATEIFQEINLFSAYYYIHYLLIIPQENSDF